MHYNLLFNGCSFTYGAELEGKDKDTEYQRTHRFSHLVANSFDMTYDNLSMPGNCNDRITRETIEWFEKGNTCDLAIIQFTKISRVEYVTDRGNRVINFPFHEGFHSKNKYKNTINYDDIMTAHQSYYRDVYNNNLGSYNFYKNLFILEQYFEKKSIRYSLMILGDTDIFNTDCLNYYWEAFCKTDYESITAIRGGILDLDNRDNFTKDYRKDGYHYLTGMHPSEIGHQRIADYLIDIINKKKI
jgi:hypothetical protein